MSLLLPWFFCCSFVALRHHFLVYGSQSQPKYRSLTNGQIQDVITMLWYSGRNDRSQLDLNYQKLTSAKSKEDESPKKLFTKFDREQKLFSKPTVKKLIEIFELYDNAKGNGSGPNTVDKEKLADLTDSFLDELMKTQEVHILRVYLLQFGYERAKNESKFRQALRDIWFSTYTRGKEDSSAFKHIFVGEFHRKKKEVNGMHSWIRFEMLEKRDQVDYAGYIVKTPFVSLIHYKWKNYWKPVGSMFIGTSPEFDLAVYTLCYLTKPGQDKCSFFIGDCTKVKVTSLLLKRDDRTYLGSAFPSLGKVSDNCPFKQPLVTSSAIARVTHPVTSSIRTTIGCVLTIACRITRFYY